MKAFFLLGLFSLSAGAAVVNCEMDHTMTYKNQFSLSVEVDETMASFDGLALDIELLKAGRDSEMTTLEGVVSGKLSLIDIQTIDHRKVIRLEAVNKEAEIEYVNLLADPTLKYMSQIR
ncbi:MAG: hypothetical protein ACJ76H_08605, partial [Bacteriovoracaceae bacterium]